MLTRDEFATAVKDALRHSTRPDMLVGNPLLQAGILAQGSDGKASTENLREALTETAKTLFANTRDEKLQRVLDLTYFNPAPKQEAAAERLGLPFSTYRRHLTTGVERMVDWLWLQEQEIRRDGHPERPPKAEEAASAQDRTIQQSAVRRRLSIVVLPFLNLSDDPAMEYFVDGIVDSLITDLSRALPGSFVVSRSTAFTFKGRRVPIRQIGEELQVRYVLEGSVLADATKVRVNAQLIDARADEHLWAERFDKERRDVLEVQDEIVGRLARSVGIEVVRSEAARSHITVDDGDDPVDLVMRANAQIAGQRQKEAATKAVALFERALALDPDNADALTGIASTRIFQVLNNYQTAGRDELLDQAEALISHTETFAADHIGVMKARAVLLRARGRFSDAIIADMLLIAQNPGEPTAYRELGLNNLYLGRSREAVDWFRRADRIAPRDPGRWTWLQGLGRALIQIGQDAEGVEALRLALHANPHLSRDLAYLSAGEALIGNADQAKLYLAKFLKLDPGITIHRFIKERASVPLDAVSPIYLRENQRILEGLRLAGMPEG